MGDHCFVPLTGRSFDAAVAAFEYRQRNTIHDINAKSMPLHTPARKLTRLVPMTLSQDMSLHQAIQRTWEQITLISNGQTAFGGFPMPYDPSGLIADEADARRHLDHHLLTPMEHMVNSLAVCARSLLRCSAPLDARIDRNIVEALARVTRTIVRGEDARGPFHTPTHDAQCLQAPSLDRSRLARDIRHNEEAHDLHERLDAAARDRQESPDTTLYGLPDDQAIQAAKRRISKPRADYSLNWLGCSDLDEVAGGIPFYVLEVKDPNRLSFEHMRQILTAFSDFIDNEEDQDLFDSDRTIRFRFVYCLCDALLDARAEGGLQAIGHLYSQILYKRQTYGALSSSEWLLTMSIDWDHPSQPGQHVGVTLIHTLGDAAVPTWVGSQQYPDFFRYGLCTAVQQLTCGLVPIQVFERVITELARKHAQYAEAILAVGQSINFNEEEYEEEDDAKDDDYSDGSGGPDSDLDDSIRRRRRPRRCSRPAASTRPLRTRPLPPAADTGDASASVPATGSGSTAQLLRILANTSSQVEVERFLALDESVVAIPYRKDELLKILYATTPFSPQPGAGGIRSVQDRAATKRRRPDRQIDTDDQLFTFGSIWNGWLPEDYCRRLAWMDYPESAKLLRIDARRSRPRKTSATSTGLGHPPGCEERDVCDSASSGSSSTSSNISSRLDVACPTFRLPLLDPLKPIADD